MKACKNCRYIVTVEKTCPKCHGELSEKFSGMVIMLDPERSEIAKNAKINAVGTYAIKVK
ncbi:MAG TPA: transcription elongation factor subunit Spt4 [Candidatus Bilamarchaeaceae archaeon]|nr:transcription elongation factor subunit Spt4 [Candidatus Bilamarchaeaceae archaeon]